MLHRMVAELSANAGIPKPRVCVIPEDAPNAFATGRDPEHGVVAVTDGIMRILSPEELRGVIAHEIGHIANRDILIQTIAGVLASVIVSIANFMQFAAIFGSSNDEEGGTNPIACLLYTSSRQRSILSWSPMTPVDMGMISCGASPVRAATMRRVSRQFSRPSSPVQALAWPELASTARQVPYSRRVCWPVSYTHLASP